MACLSAFVEAIADVDLLGQAATEAGLQAALGKQIRWRAVHLACHGLVDPDQPMLSALALTPDGEADDGMLTALEVRARPRSYFAGNEVERAEELVKRPHEMNYPTGQLRVLLLCR